MRIPKGEAIGTEIPRWSANIFLIIACYNPKFPSGLPRGYLFKTKNLGMSIKTQAYQSAN